MKVLLSVRMVNNRVLFEHFLLDIDRDNRVLMVVEFSLQDLYLIVVYTFEYHLKIVLKHIHVYQELFELNLFLMFVKNEFEIV